MKLNARELRDVDEKEIQEKLKHIKRQPIYFILENIYDTYNIGGLFRLADALAIKKLYLCGETEIPPNHRIKKASIGTYKVVEWQYCKTAKEAIEELKSKVKIQNSNLSIRQAQDLFEPEQPQSRRPECIEGQLKTQNKNQDANIQIIAVEQHETAIDYRKADYSFPVALLFGNETYGVLPETLKSADKIVEIPMFGVNKSLNVIVSAAIVSYHVAMIL